MSVARGVVVLAGVLAGTATAVPYWQHIEIIFAPGCTVQASGVDPLARAASLRAEAAAIRRRDTDRQASGRGKTALGLTVLGAGIAGIASGTSVGVGLGFGLLTPGVMWMLEGRSERARGRRDASAADRLAYIDAVGRVVAEMQRR